jgi:hypothetical protein
MARRAVWMKPRQKMARVQSFSLLELSRPQISQRSRIAVLPLRPFVWPPRALLANSDIVSEAAPLIRDYVNPAPYLPKQPVPCGPSTKKGSPPLCQATGRTYAESPELHNSVEQELITAK